MRNEGQTLQLGKWRPDLNRITGSDTCVKALNVLPRVGGYGSFSDIHPTSPPVGEKVQASFCLQIPQNNFPAIYAASINKIKQFINGAWTDCSNGTYATSEPCFDFTQIGQHIFATNINHNIQYQDGLNAGSAFVDIQSSPLFTPTITDTFNNQVVQNLPPKANYCATFKNFLVLGHTDGGTQRVHWSALGNPFFFPEPTARLASEVQSGYTDLNNDAGQIVGFAGFLDYLLIFQQRAITRMSFRGQAGEPFDFSQTISVDVGALSNGAITSYEGITYFWAEDGFYGTDGANLRRIGANQVDKYFWDKIDYARRFEISSVYDPQNKVVMWSFAEKNTALISNNSLAIFNVDDERWAEVKYKKNKGLTALVRMLSSGIAVGQLGNDYPTAPDWAGSSFIAAFTGENRFGDFRGRTLSWEIETGEYIFNQGYRSFTTEVRPHIEDAPLVIEGEIELIPIRRERSSDLLVRNPTQKVNKQGFCPIRLNAEYQRFHFQSARTMRHFGSFEIYTTRAGRH
jgi:hypothetical protein